MPSWLLSGVPVSEPEAWALSAAYHLGHGFNLVPLKGEHFADLYTFKTSSGGIISAMWNGQVDTKFKLSRFWANALHPSFARVTYFPEYHILTAGVPPEAACAKLFGAIKERQKVMGVVVWQ